MDLEKINDSYLFAPKAIDYPASSAVKGQPPMHLTIDNLRLELNQLVLSADPPMDSYADIRLSRILSARQIRTVLNSVVKDKKLLQTVALHSYTHSNGFDKITLISSKDPEYKLRIHVWWPRSNSSGDLPTELIHDHRWHFRSTVLLGSLRLELFQRAEEGANMFEYRYHPRDQRQQIYSMDLVGQTVLSSGFKTQLATGSVYSLRSGTYHRVIYDTDDISATVFLRWGSTKDTAEVFSAVQISSPNRIAVPSFSMSETETKLLRLLPMLAE